MLWPQNVLLTMIINTGLLSNYTPFQVLWTSKTGLQVDGFCVDGISCKALIHVLRMRSILRGSSQALRSSVLANQGLNHPVISGNS